MMDSRFSKLVCFRSVIAKSIEKKDDDSGAGGGGGISRVGSDLKPKGNICFPFQFRVVVFLFFLKVSF